MLEFETEFQKIGAGLSYLELKASIQQTHPVDEQGKKYSICSHMGSFPCFGVIDGNTGKTKVLISDAQKDLGLGPTLMLMTTRSLGYLFVILALVNIPLCMLYNSGETSINHISISLPELFSMISLGNIGEESKTCEVSKFNGQSYKSKALYCRHGYLKSLQLVGFVNNL